MTLACVSFYFMFLGPHPISASDYASLFALAVMVIMLLLGISWGRYQWRVLTFTIYETLVDAPRNFSSVHHVITCEGWRIVSSIDGQMLRAEIPGSWTSWGRSRYRTICRPLRFHKQHR